MARMGRPKKKFNRRHVTVFVDESILAMIDDHVAKIKKTNREYTRSDFINEAAQRALAQLYERKENGNDR